MTALEGKVRLQWAQVLGKAKFQAEFTARALCRRVVITEIASLLSLLRNPPKRRNLLPEL